jgi:hypothetical protein
VRRSRLGLAVGYCGLHIVVEEIARRAHKLAASCLSPYHVDESLFCKSSFTDLRDPG